MAKKKTGRLKALPAGLVIRGNDVLVDSKTVMQQLLITSQNEYRKL
jgi:hypothetical protein